MTGSSDTRTIWRAKPCGWRDRERVVALGEEFGPAGPLLLDVLEELAKEQRADGAVRTGLRALARAAFLPRGRDGIELARRVLEFAAELEALDDLEIADEAAAEMRVTCRVSGFESDQGRGAAAVRKARSRDVTTGPVVTRDVTTPAVVTECHLTGEERTESPPYPPQAGGQAQLRALPETLFPPAPPRPLGARRRDREKHERQRQAWEARRRSFAERHFPDVHPDAVLNTALLLRRQRIEPTVANLATALRGSTEVVA